MEKWLYWKVRNDCYDTLEGKWNINEALKHITQEIEENRTRIEVLENRIKELEVKNNNIKN